MTALRTAPLLLSLAFSLLGCSEDFALRPPASRTLAEPLLVAVLDHGRHTSLVIGLPDGRMARYAYGDWRWYAEGRTGPLEGLAALFGDTPAALGRQVLPGPLKPETLRRQVRSGFEEVYILEVEAEKARRLVAQLDAIAEAGRDRSLYNAEVDLTFFPHPEPYSQTHNSNEVIAKWLRELGIEVEGEGLVATWRVKE